MYTVNPTRGVNFVFLIKETKEKIRNTRTKIFSISVHLNYYYYTCDVAEDFYSLGRKNFVFFNALVHLTVLGVMAYRKMTSINEVGGSTNQLLPQRMK